MTMLIVYFFLTILFTLQVQSTGSPDFSKLNDLMQYAINNRAFPGGTIVIANSTSILFKQNYGQLSYQYELYNIDVANYTRYDVASITKIMSTTLCLMNLASSNSIKIDDLVSKYIPNYDTNKKGNTTVGNLLLHNSGLPYDYPGGLPNTTQQVIDYITFAKPEFPVGSKFQYSNLGFLLLGEIIAKVSKKSLNAYFDQNKIFARLMDTKYKPAQNEAYRIAPTEYDAEVRKRIVKGEAHERLAYFFNGVAGHSGLFTTADDLIRYMRIILNKGRIPGETSVLSESIINQFTSRVPGLPYDNTRSYGFDTACPGTKMSNCIGHDGSTGIMAWTDNDKKIAFVVLTNRGHPDVKNGRFDEYKGRIADEIFEALGS